MGVTRVSFAAALQTPSVNDLLPGDTVTDRHTAWGQDRSRQKHRGGQSSFFSSRGGLLRKRHADNWCGPNIPALKVMLSDCSFPSVNVVYRTPIARNILSVGRGVLRGESSPWRAVQQGRAVVHARR